MEGRKLNQNQISKREKQHSVDVQGNQGYRFLADPYDSSKPAPRQGLPWRSCSPAPLVPDSHSAQVLLSALTPSQLPSSPPLPLALVAPTHSEESNNHSDTKFWQQTKYTDRATHTWTALVGFLLFPSDSPKRHKCHCTYLPSTFTLMFISP